MESIKYKTANGKLEDQNTRNASGNTDRESSGKSAAEKVRLKDGPWHQIQKDNTQYNPEGKSIEEATDPSKLSQL